MLDSLVCFLDAIRWPEMLGAFASVATAMIALCALRTWRHQEKAKIKAEFLDALIDTVHSYIAEMSRPLTLLKMAKIGIEAHMPTWERTGQSDIAVKGAIAYIQRSEGRDSERLLKRLETVQPLAIRLRSLAAKGQIFELSGYEKCQRSIAVLTSHFDRLEGFMAVMGSPSLNWEHPEVLGLLKDILDIDPDEIRKNMRDENATLLKFTSASYKRIYG